MSCSGNIQCCREIAWPYLSQVDDAGGTTSTVEKGRSGGFGLFSLEFLLGWPEWRDGYCDGRPPGRHQFGVGGLQALAVRGVYDTVGAEAGTVEEGMEVRSEAPDFARGIP